MFDNTRQAGSFSENLAKQFLIKNGYQIIDQNFTIRGGEIDLITKKNGILVFVEVKARYNHKFGLPQESITYFKMKALQKTALFYITKIKWGDREYRFDLVSLDFTLDKENPTIELIENIGF